MCSAEMNDKEQKESLSQTHANQMTVSKSDQVALGHGVQIY